MRAQTLPAGAGIHWLTGGFAIYRRNPPLLSMVVVAYWFTVVLCNIIPVLGAIVASLVIPGLSVGVMQACRQLERGEGVNITTLFGGLRQNTRALLALGAIYLLATLGILGVSALTDGGEFLRFMLSPQPVEKETLESGALLFPVTVVMVLLVPLLMAYWFAPVLAAWHDLSPAKALFFSFVACWINWRAFTAYSLVFLLLVFFLPALSLGVLAMIFPLGHKLLMTAFTLLVVLVVAPVVFASFYVSYRDIFGFSASA